MRIVIDLQGAQSNSRFRGVGRYSLSLTIGIIKASKSDDEVLILLNGILGETIENIRYQLKDLIPQSHIKVWSGYAPTNYVSRESSFNRESAKILREAYINTLNPDVLLVTSMVEGYDDDSVLSAKRYFSTPTASVFYDAIPLLQSDKYLIDGSLYKEFYLQKIEEFQHCDLLLGISQSACQEAIEALNFDSNSVQNINAAVDEKFKPIDITPTEKETIYNKFIEAFSLLPQDIKNDYQLVIAGGIPYRTRWDFMKHAKKLKLKKSQIIFTDWVEDDELLALYNLCELFVYPSWHEGFGLPVLEAMRCATAVIGANTTSIPEVIGDENALFDPFDSQSIADKIIEYLRDDEKRVSLANYGLKRSEIFSWEKSGRLVLEAIKERRDIFHHKVDRIDDRDHMLDKITTLISEIKPKEPNDISLLNISKAISINHPKIKQRQLLLDISELVQYDAKSGIQRVVRNLLREMITNPPSGYSVEAIYATDNQLGYRYAKNFIDKFLENKEDGSIDEPIELRSDDIFLGLDMAPSVQIYQSKTFERYRQLGIKVYFIIHDLLPVLNPQWWTKVKRDEKIVVDNFERWLDIIIQNHGAICVSHNTADDLKKWIEEYRPQCKDDFEIYVSHNGADINESRSNDSLADDDRATLDLIDQRETFLMVGTIEPRKGQMQTIKAFDILWSDGIDINLVIVGKQGWAIEELIEIIEKHPERDKRLFWLNSISDLYLEELYKRSSALILSSQGEGFGLPLIEAAQHRLPIIARDIPVFREVAKDYAYYFKDTQDPNIISETIIRWIELYKKDHHPKSDKMPWLTWRESSQNLLSIILRDTYE